MSPIEVNYQVETGYILLQYMSNSVQRQGMGRIQSTASAGLHT